MIWTDEASNTLKNLWTDGKLSAEAIGKEMGGIGRNAVIGRAHRMGLSLRRPPGAPKKPRKSRAKHEARSTPFRKPVVIVPPDEPFVPVPDMEIPLEQRKSLIELTDKTCRWPIGTPGVDLFFCGAPPAPEAVYCRQHCAIGYLPSRR